MPRFVDRQRTDRAQRQQRQPTAARAEATAKTIKDMLFRHVQSSKGLIDAINANIRNTTGGRSAVVTALGTDSAECLQMFTKIVNFVNAHQEESAADTSI